jgi:hypothetical protein
MTCPTYRRQDVDKGLRLHYHSDSSYRDMKKSIIPPKSLIDVDCFFILRPAIDVQAVRMNKKNCSFKETLHAQPPTMIYGAIEHSHRPSCGHNDRSPQRRSKVMRDASDNKGSEPLGRAKTCKRTLDDIIFSTQTCIGGLQNYEIRVGFTLLILGNPCQRRPETRSAYSVSGFVKDSDENSIRFTSSSLSSSSSVSNF